MIRGIVGDEKDKHVGFSVMTDIATLYDKGHTIVYITNALGLRLNQTIRALEILQKVETVNTIGKSGLT